MTLAISSYADLPAFESQGRILNLAWTTDERDFLTVDLAGILRLELAEELQCELPYLRSYLVGDPYGEQHLRDAVAGFFSLQGSAFSIACGAGVNSLLHALAPLANGRPAYVIGDVYPDFPHWLIRAGGGCVSAPREQSIGGHIAGVRAHGAALLLVERPSVSEKQLTLMELRELCLGVFPAGTCVLIDESYANYFPPSFSAVSFVEEVQNLAVLRGLSKAYSLGGLRLGYCVASSNLTGLLRAAIPPMLVSSLSLRIGRKVLELGDVTQRLRERIAEAKAETISLLKQAGVIVDAQASKHMPHLHCSGGGVQERMERLGVVGKVQPFWAGTFKQSYRLSVPLSADRLGLLRDKMGNS